MVRLLFDVLAHGLRGWPRRGSKARNSGVPHGFAASVAATVVLSEEANIVFVVELIYKADLEAIDAAMKEHVAFLNRNYAAGHFLVSGRKVPRDGGVIVVVGLELASVEALMREDPFVSQGLADVRIIEFRASQRAKDLQACLDREPAQSWPSGGRKRG